MINRYERLNQELKMVETKRKVAAYCRVSTDNEDQANSFESQQRYFRQYIERNPDWELYEIFADEGISGTNTKKRKEFNRMIACAKNGDFDLIITKEISRFARNTLDSIYYTRDLKKHGVGVIFMNDNINTLDGDAELRLAIMSSIAQEESRNISENIRWGIARIFEKGKVLVNCAKFMGYTKIENGDLILVPKEAEIVRLIYRLYLEGYSSVKIKKYLEDREIKTATGQERWHTTVIDNMLCNEKYMGDALLQKTYTVDFMTKKRVVNNGIVPQYYVENDHEAIIPKEIYYRVQEERMRRANLCKAAVTRKKNQKSKYSSLYALTGMVICGKCGHEYRRVTWSRNGQKKIVWRCSNRLTNGVKKCPNSETIKEEALNRAVMEAIHRITCDDREFIETFRQNVISVINTKEALQEENDYDTLLKNKQEEMLALIMEYAKAGEYTQEFDARYHAIAEEIQAIKKNQTETRKREETLRECNQRMYEIDDFLRTTTCRIPEFDNDLVRRLISTVKIISEEKLMIQFKSGIVVEQEIRYD